ncbi:hypothetical protein N0V93_003549 [Gnomoniopsis smithogilvyi]|uniref:Uncharacterized protein n=1 Tax=Gnomoniopsis smithogilvyi TaxID=1191159 RepID=A0A9W9CZY6_9PEZI|nr:hypothetical protein N0V93_003549 [Gnomoniopsis smithogilvyi]
MLADYSTMVCSPARETSMADQTFEAVNRPASLDVTGTPTQAPHPLSRGHKHVGSLFSPLFTPEEHCACEDMEDDNAFSRCLLQNLCTRTPSHPLCKDIPAPPDPPCCADKSDSEFAKCITEMLCSRIDLDECHNDATSLTDDDVIASLKNLHGS